MAAPDLDRMESTSRISKVNSKLPHQTSTFMSHRVSVTTPVYPKRRNLRLKPRGRREDYRTTTWVRNLLYSEGERIRFLTSCELSS